PRRRRGRRGPGHRAHRGHEAVQRDQVGPRRPRGPRGGRERPARQGQAAPHRGGTAVTPHRAAHITGWGRYAPSQVLTNRDLERMVDTSDEWIVTRTGIRE